MLCLGFDLCVVWIWFVCRFCLLIVCAVSVLCVVRCHRLCAVCVCVSVNVFSFLVVCVVAVLYGVACCCCAPSCLMFFFVSWLSMVQCSFYVWLVEDWVLVVS